MDTTKVMTEEQVFHKRLENAMWNTWTEIGSDTLQMIQEQDGRDWAKREEVIEMVLDAGRMEHHLTIEDKERYRGMKFKKLMSIARHTFTAGKYC